MGSYKKICLLLTIAAMTCLGGCKKLVDVSAPPTSLSAGNVFNTDATAISAMTGLYTTISNEYFSTTGITNLSLYPELSADELDLYTGLISTTFNLYYSYLLSSTNTGYDFWEISYSYLFQVNSALDGLNAATGLTPAIRQQLMGEAKFMRAFFYFYLVNLYGDVPLATTSNYAVNALLPRTAASKVYQQIVADLKDAQSLLSPTYLDGTLLKQTTQRTRPIQATATALLSRIYLYTQQWDSAEAQATAVINNSLYSLDTLNGAFLMNNPEAIWQLQPVSGATKNTVEGLVFIIPATGPGNATPVFLSKDLIGAFEPGDQRRKNWVDSTISVGVTYYFPFKYKINNILAPVSEYIMVMRLAEQYLIRAEARAQQNDLSGATADMNTIRTRAGLPGTTATSQTDLITAIQHERQVELFTEWGDRWLNLKRTGTVNTVMAAASIEKGAVWNSDWQYYPIPLSELQADPHLVQNSGY
jgi:starch-binding outer membrane protein, SusD/RagB family